MLRPAVASSSSATASASACPACSTRRLLYSSSTRKLPPVLDLHPPSTAFDLPPPSFSKPSTLKQSQPGKSTRTFRARKAALELSPTAVERIKDLLDSPTPQLLRIGVRNKGCAGMSYHLEYVDKPSKFDEVVEQDGVKVVIDSKALFSIIGSKMDWEESPLGAKFVFNNPNIKDACGCGEYVYLFLLP
ncbi:hypothetical protein T439DRAFT_291708 [Meredithblackwellia eburnea MCA 4105]